MLTISEFLVCRHECGTTIACGRCTFLIRDEADPFRASGWCCEHHHKTTAGMYCRSFEATPPIEPVVTEAPVNAPMLTEPPPSAPTTGAELRAWRLARGLSQAQLGRELGLKQPAVARAESCDQLPAVVVRRLGEGGPTR